MKVKPEKRKTDFVGLFVWVVLVAFSGYSGHYHGKAKERADHVRTLSHIAGKNLTALKYNKENNVLITLTVDQTCHLYSRGYFHQEQIKMLELQRQIEDIIKDDYEE